MSIKAPREVFKSIMSSLGYREWRKSFDPDNLPKTLADKSFHLQVDGPSGVKQNQNDLEVNIPVTVTIAQKGYADEAKASEALETALERILLEALKPSRRIGSDGIKNIIFNDARPEPIAPSNDNVILYKVSFTCLVILGL